MEVYYSILIFIIILGLYFNIVSHYKKSEDLEIYEMDFVENKQLQEVCDVKQPVLFNIEQIDPGLFQQIPSISNLQNSDVKIKDTNDYSDLSSPTDSVDYVVLSMHNALQLMKTDNNAHFITETNHDYIEETNMQKHLQEYDAYLKPYFTIQTKYDICVGSEGAVTPLRYNNEYRNYYMVKQGKIRVKMTPWRSHKYLHPIEDYDNYEFFSQLNPWKPQSKYAHEMDKLKFLEFTVHAGSIIYIPPYWWYSMKYEADTLLYGFQYNTAMNTIAHSKQWLLHFIQHANTKTKIAKTLDMSQVEEDTIPMKSYPEPKDELPVTNTSAPTQEHIN